MFLGVSFQASKSTPSWVSTGGWAGSSPRVVDCNFSAYSGNSNLGAPKHGCPHLEGISTCISSLVPFMQTISSCFHSSQANSGGENKRLFVTQDNAPILHMQTPGHTSEGWRGRTGLEHNFLGVFLSTDENGGTCDNMCEQLGLCGLSSICSIFQRPLCPAGQELALLSEQAR